MFLIGEPNENPKTQMKDTSTSQAANGLSTESGTSESTELHTELLLSTLEYAFLERKSGFV